jgi:hypothetical protein
MLLALALIYYALIGFDAAFTLRRMKKFGVNVEANPWIKGLCKLCGLEFGLVAALLAPASLVSLVLLMTHFQVGFALLIGFRVRLSYIQIQTLKFEKQIQDYMTSGAGKSAPPSARSDSKTVVEAQPPSDSKDKQC